MAIDTEKLKELTDEARSIEQEIREIERQKLKLLEEMDAKIKNLKTKEYRISSKIKKLFPEEFWTCEIDQSYHGPLHYKIKCISYSLDRIYITTKDIRKKKPFDGWKGINDVLLDDFIKIGLYDSYNAALDGYKHRICPNCGGFMGNSSRLWCDKCIAGYEKYLEDNTNRYYDAKQGHVFEVKPDVDHPVLSRYFWKGYDGHYFKIRRLDTGEIIETHNLWSCGFHENTDNYPLIEFIDQNDNVSNAPRPTLLG